MASEVTAVLAVPSDKVRAAPNGIDPERVQSRDSGAALALHRRRWADDCERIVVFVGRLVREKGVEVLIDAMPHVLRRCPEAKLVVAGAGARDHLEARARSRGVDRKVLFTGFLPEEDLSRLYGVADVAVFPSLYEPFGIVALEAMAAGAPVVSSDIGGLREVVTHEETGVHTWANNPESLAWGICRVLSDQTLARQLRRRGRREVQERYGWASVARETIGVYSEVLDEVEMGGRSWPARPPVAHGLSVERVFERS
jgi:glycosyltransferase involved in cell wall biosynthesis